MLISKRRLRWFAITTLVMCLLLLCRPTRNWVDRMLVAQFVGPTVSVGELVVHRHKSIVEARELEWSAIQGDRKLQFSARCGWFAYDKLGLVDRHTRLPKVIFQEANLRLEGAPPAPPAQLDRWKQRLALQITQLDWNAINHQLGSLIATRELKQSWSNGIKRCVDRSQQILAEADELERQTAKLDNPLRFEVSIHDKLDRLQALSREQRQLTDQLEELSNQVESETVRLRELHRQDQLKLVGLVIGNAAAHDLQLERENISLDLAEDLGYAFWLRFASYGEIVDRMASATQGYSQRPSYDVNIRSNRHGNEWLQLTEWKASGDFSNAELQTPFQASGSWSLTQEPLLQSSLDFAWRATFFLDQAQVDVRAEHLSQKSDTTELHMQIGKSKTNRRNLALIDPGDLGAERTSGAHVKLTSQSGKLEGELAVPANAFDWIESTTLAALMQFASQPEAEPLRFRIAGPWTEVHLELVGAVPVWLSQAVASEADACNQIASQTSKLQLEQTFTSELLQLQQLVNSALSESKPLAADHTRQLLAKQDRLQRQLDDRNGTEFARRPGAITR